MRILITNDDGIQASQLIPLIHWAQKRKIKMNRFPVWKAVFLFYSDEMWDC